jgi:hypothetical protein
MPPPSTAAYYGRALLTAPDILLDHGPHVENKQRKERRREH